MDLVERSGSPTVRHPWETARANFFLDVLARQGLFDRPHRWLDVGAGDGWFAGELRKQSTDGDRIVCWDINYSADDILSENIEATRERPQARFDVILMLDVMEHVEEDQPFLDGIVQDLAEPHGFILVSVPAHMRLYTSHDEALRHYRRYAPKQCRHVLEQAGLTVLEDGGLFHLLGLARWGEAMLERSGRRKVSSEGIGAWRGGKQLTTTVGGVLRAENAASLAFAKRGWTVPGLSYWALCTN
jgi:hypothetical protein